MPDVYLISPTEPAPIRSFGQTSSVPEQLGADVVWSGRNGLCGIQRKEIQDFIASIRDTRLGMELEQMRRLSFKALIVEGRTQWTRDGFLLSSAFARWSRKEHRGALLSVQLRGVPVLTTDDHVDTLEAIDQLRTWSLKEPHDSSLLYRGNAKDEWGQLTDRATAVHFLSGLPGVGVTLAGRIFDAFGVPIGWTIAFEDLLAVPGIGKKTAEKIWRVFGAEESE